MYTQWLCCYSSWIVVKWMWASMAVHLYDFWQRSHENIIGKIENNGMLASQQILVWLIYLCWLKINCCFPKTNQKDSWLLKKKLLPSEIGFYKLQNSWLETKVKRLMNINVTNVSSLNLPWKWKRMSTEFDAIRI